MRSKRIWIGIGLGAVAVAVLANVKWVEVKRELYMDGGVQREYRILGRFSYTALRRDSRIEASRAVSAKFADYGLTTLSTDDSAMVDVEASKTGFFVHREGQGDIHQESARLAKTMPWLSQVWGSRNSHLYARGHHPKLGGLVEVSCGRLPERKHGPGKLRYSISVTE